MKRIKWLFGLCLIMFVVCGSGGSVQAYSSNVTDDGIKYDTYTGVDGITIVGYSGENETVVIPSEIDGEPVTRISGSFFCTNKIKHCIISDGVSEIYSDVSWIVRGPSTIESVSLPDTIKTIGDGVFAKCVNLSNITLPESLTSIGEGVFYECSSLTSVKIPDKVISIERSMFECCGSLKSVEIPDNVTSIGQYAFYECYQLNNIIIPEGLISIGSHAFCRCKTIGKLIIPDSVTQIDECAFSLSYDDRIPIYGNPDSYVKKYCDTDYKIKFSCISHPNIVDVPAVAPNCRQYGKTAGTRCTVCGSYVIKPQEIRPNGQHIWEVSKFRNATVRHIGEKISICTVCRIVNVEKIPKLALPQKGKTVRESSSDNDYKVTKAAVKNGTVELSKVDKAKSSVTVPDTIAVNGVTYKVISISKNAFKGNRILKKVTIGKNVTKINANAFHGCKNLKTVTVKSTQIKTVGKNAFKGINPKAKIKVPKSKLKYYKKLFAKKGLKSTVKIVK